MISSLVGLVRQRTEVEATIPIDRCFHYRGFRYGGFGNNLYEDYMLGLAQGEPVQRLRTWFADAVLRCRPRDMAEALQLDLAWAPAWKFPWQPGKMRDARDIVLTPGENPDVICHYSPEGVLASHINREFAWLENAFDNIRLRGYQPDRISYIVVLQMVSQDATSYLVLDGNHRLSALHALGANTVRVKRKSGVVHRSEVERWPGVASGQFSRQDALAIFDRYFAVDNPPLAELHPAQLIRDQAPLWEVTLDSR